MKSLIFILALIMFGCQAPTSETATETRFRTNSGNGKVFVYDGCQYLKIGTGVTHKGNCNNKFHFTDGR